jgi:RHS repeat-associated protein
MSGDLTIQQSPSVAIGSVHVLVSGIRVSSVSSSGILYYHRDRLGSIVATTLANGVVGAGYRYATYGGLIAMSGESTANASELGYTDALKLSHGLLYFSARVYNPNIARFMQADDIDALRYAYAAGDPVNHTDSSGHYPIRGVAFRYYDSYYPVDRVNPTQAADGTLSLYPSITATRSTAMTVPEDAELAFIQNLSQSLVGADTVYANAYGVSGATAERLGLRWVPGYQDNSLGGSTTPPVPVVIVYVNGHWEARSSGKFWDTFQRTYDSDVKITSSYLMPSISLSQELP